MANASEKTGGVCFLRVGRRLEYMCLKVRNPQISIKINIDSKIK